MLFCCYRIIVILTPLPHHTTCCMLIKNIIVLFITVKDYTMPKNVYAQEYERAEAALLSASREGHTETVEILLNTLREAGSDIQTALNHTNNGFANVLQDALENLTETVEFLLDALVAVEPGADIQTVLQHKNNDGETVLLSATRKDHIVIVALLLNALVKAGADIQTVLQHENNDGQTALQLASQEGHTETVELLLNTLRDAGADMQTVLNHADNNGTTALLLVTRMGANDLVQTLLGLLGDAGADMQTALNHADNEGQTALLLASRLGHTKILQLLLNTLRDAGADIQSVLNHVNNDGQTALLLASQEGHTETVELLLNTLCDASADMQTVLNHTNNWGNTTLHMALARGAEDIVQLLLNTLRDAGADMKTVLNHANSFGKTALQDASREGHTEIVELLLNTLREAGADMKTALNHTSNGGNTALQYALEGLTVTVEFLLDALVVVEPGADMQTALNYANNKIITAPINSPYFAKTMLYTQIVNMLLTQGASLTNADAIQIGRIIASVSKPAIAQEKLQAILQNGDLTWVDEDYVNFNSKSTVEQASLCALASTGIIVGNKRFVAKLIACRQDNLSYAEYTEYLRLALQAQNLAVAEILLKHVPDNSVEPIINRQSILNYLLHLMVIERGSDLAINFLLAQGAVADTIICAEYRTQMGHSLYKLFIQHTNYQMKKIWRYSPCASINDSLSKLTLFSNPEEDVPNTAKRLDEHLTALILERDLDRKLPSFLEGIQSEAIGTRINAYNHQWSLFHMACYQNRPHVLSAIGSSMLKS